MNPDRRRQAVVLGAYLLTVVVNGLAVALPLNGQSTADISARFPTLVTPANYVFGIWSVIYALLLVFSIYQALPGRATDPALRAVGYLPAVAGILNSIWLVLWHYNVFALTVPVMVGILASLIVIHHRLGIGRRAAASWAEVIAVRLPWSVYLGWITIATIANVATTLVWLEWDGFGISPEIWAVATLAIGVAIAAAMSLTRRDLAYAVVIVWAYAGIAVKQADTTIVAGAAVAGAVIVAGLALWALFGRRSAAPQAIA
jgi:hypothetical protein